MTPDKPTATASTADDGKRKEPVFPLEQTGAFLLAMLIGLLAVVAATHHVPHACARASMVAFASVSLGALLGFLFGVPPTSAEPSGAQENKANGGIQRNTSLHEISSWLTKIIVGAGLVNLNQLAVWIGDRGAEIAKDLAPRTQSTFGSALIVYFFIVGFISAYTYTRTKVASLFAESDHWIVASLERKITAATQETVKKVENQMAQQRESTREIVERTTLESRMLIALYSPPPDGYLLALAVAEELGAEALSAYGNYYLACALGQQLAHDQKLDENTQRSVRDRAYDALLKATKDPTVKELAARLYRGELGSGENDFDAFRGEARFDALLPSTRAETDGPTKPA